MSAAAIIPARGGSKGLPRKNVRPLCGKPLIAWTIEAALQASRVNRVIVSTDDHEIASVSRQFGAEVVWRPEELSRDDSMVEGALLHALEEAQIDQGVFSFLQCTSPLMLSGDIDGVIERVEMGADVAFTAIPWHYFAWEMTGDGAMPIGHSTARRPMRQELHNRYLEVGAAYAMTVEGFRQARNRFHGRIEVVPIDPDRSIEIDSAEDFRMAETLLLRRLSIMKAQRLPKRIEAVVMDFDGVLTDNRVHVDESGEESVVCNRGDGYGLSLLREAGVHLLVITHETNPVVMRRCEKLGVECIVARGAKLPYLVEWLHQRRLDPRHVLYVGNDRPDVDCMQNVGCGVAPGDAYEDAKRAAQIVLETAGGMGCIRELADLISLRSGVVEHESAVDSR